MHIAWYTLTSEHFTVRIFTSLVSLNSEMCSTVSVLIDKSLIALNHSPESIMRLLEISTTNDALTIQLQTHFNKRTMNNTHQ